MADLASSITVARNAGYSDADITAYLAKDPTLGPQVDQARKSGYSDGEVVAYLASVKPKERSLIGAISEGLSNIPSHLADAARTIDAAPANAARTISGVVFDPAKRAQAAAAISGVENRIGATVGGYVQQVRDLSSPDSQGSAPRMDTAPAQQAEAGIVNKYGVNVTPQRVAQALQGQNLGQPNANAYRTLKTDFAEHPLTVIANAAPLVGKAAGVVGDAVGAADALASAGKVAGKVAGKAVSIPLGATTGVGPTAIEEAAKAGFRTGMGDAEAGRVFKDNLSGAVPTTDVVQEAKNGVSQMFAQRAADYRKNIAPVSNDKTVLPFGDIQKAVEDVKGRGSYKGQDINPAAADVWKKVNDAVTDWGKLDPAEYHTPEGLDALKRKIGSIQQGEMYGSPARSVADNAYNAIKGVITEQAPAYAKAMQAYEAASTQLSELQRSLSLGSKASAETAVRKLQSILRNNVNSGFSTRADLGRQLEENGSPNLFAALSGQALHPVLPRGLAGIAEGGAGAAAALGHVLNPYALAVAPLASPRLVGSAAYYAGKASGAVKRTLGARTAASGLGSGRAAAATAAASGVPNVFARSQRTPSR